MTKDNAIKLALEALELAQDNLRDHGDNCFLHDEGEYNRCFCGKDSLSNHLQSVVEKLDEALAEQSAQQEPCGWQFFQDGKWHNGMDVNDHRRHTEAAGFPVRDVYPSPQRAQPQQEPVAFLAESTRFKVTLTERDCKITGLPRELGGRWVALVGAENDCHLRLTTPPLLEQPTQQEPVALREALREALAAALTSVYVCGRVWSAWHIGTMTEDDFSPASECDWLLDEIVHAVATAAPQPAQRKPLTDEQVNLFINGRGDEDDDDYVEPTGDGFGLTDADLVRLVRRVEAAHEIKENT